MDDHLAYEQMSNKVGVVCTSQWSLPFFFVFTPSTSSAWPTAGSYYNIVDSHAEVRPSHASESGSSGFCHRGAETNSEFSPENWGEDEFSPKVLKIDGWKIFL